MDAIVTAGGVPQPGEYLYEETRGAPKALLDIAGKPMIQWVLDALSGSRVVERVFIVSLPAESGLTCAKPVYYLPEQGSMLENIRIGVKEVLRVNPAAHHVLVVSSDIPAITPEMVDWVADTAMQSDHDLYYNVIARQTMEARYPGSKRSYIRLKDAEFCGGDMNVIRAQTATANDELWRKIIEARKNAFKQAMLFGLDTLLLVLLRAGTLEQAAEHLSKRLKIKGRAIVCPYAEVGMDVDKPFQLEIMRADLLKRTKVGG